MNAIIRLNQPDILDLGPFLDGRGCTFHLEVLDNNDSIAIDQNIAIGILVDLLCNIFGLKFKTTFRTDKHGAIRVHILALTLRTIWEIFHMIQLFVYCYSNEATTGYPAHYLNVKRGKGSYHTVSN